MSSLSNQAFDPSLRCCAVHPVYGEQCQIHGGLAHKGRHRAVVQTGDHHVTFSAWDDLPVEHAPYIAPKLPWGARPRTGALITLAAVLGATLIIFAVFAMAVLLTQF